MTNLYKRIKLLMNQTACPESDSVYQAMNQLADEMEQDFKSRVCGNCKWFYKIPMSGGSVKCSNVETSCVHVDKYFGCNKFVRKDNK